MFYLFDECFNGRTDTLTESTAIESRTEDITQTTTAESTPIDITTLVMTVTSSEESNAKTTPVLDTGNTTEVITSDWTVVSVLTEIITTEMIEDWTEGTTEQTMITWTFNSTQSSTLRVTTPESTVERNLIIITVFRGDQVGGGGVPENPPPQRRKNQAKPPPKSRSPPPLAAERSEAAYISGFLGFFSGFLGYFRVFLGFLRSILGFYRVF